MKKSNRDVQLTRLKNKITRLNDDLKRMQLERNSMLTVNEGKDKQLKDIQTNHANLYRTINQYSQQIASLNVELSAQRDIKESLLHALHSMRIQRDASRDMSRSINVEKVGSSPFDPRDNVALAT